MALEVTTQPTAEPLDIDEVKTFLNLTSNDHDAMLGMFIKMAREWVQHTTGQALLSQTIKQYLDKWPTECGSPLKRLEWPLQLWPVSSVTSIQYIDTNGATQIWATTNYTADTKSIPARIVVTDSVIYPDLDDVPNAIIITYVAGYSTKANVPATIKAAMLQRIAFLYENREDIPINGVGDSYRVRSADALMFNNRLHLV